VQRLADTLVDLTTTGHTGSGADDGTAADGTRRRSGPLGAETSIGPGIDA
jgi:methylglyoxal synthase